MFLDIRRVIQELHAFRYTPSHTRTSRF